MLNAKGEQMNSPTSNDPMQSSGERVRRSTPERINRKIDSDTDANIACMSGQGRAEIERRIAELDREWDVERVLEVNASTLALTGLGSA